MAELFGFEIKRKSEQKEKDLQSFVPPTNDDGSLVVNEGGVYGTYVDLDGSIRTEAELVTKYRSAAMDPTIDLAIQDICNEAIVEDEEKDVVELNLEDIKTSNGIKKKIVDEFEEIKKLLEFDDLSYEIFKRWYIDGRLYYHVMIDEESTKDGIKELRYIDPRNIKKVREVKKEKKPNGVSVEKVVAEYYLYNQAGFLKKAGTSQLSASSATQAEGVKIAKDSIIYCTSGYQNEDNNLILSHLHKALRPYNQLKSMEDSLVIYRISRAPERRIFYIDVGGLPKAKAEQYLRDIMAKFKNRTVYDATTGQVRDDRKFMTMLEDFWLPRREGSRGTEITTLPGGQNLGEIDDINYFRNILYRSLNVPITRMESDSTFSLGRATEVSRDEVKFSKFINRLRKKFSTLFTKILERQLILKGICSSEDWEEWRQSIKYTFAIDNYFEELKMMEILRDRFNLLRDMEETVGKYYSHEFVRKNILRQTEQDIKEEDKRIKEEEKDPKYQEMDLDMGGDEKNQQAEQEPQPVKEPTPTEKPEPQQTADDKKEQQNAKKKDAVNVNDREQSKV